MITEAVLRDELRNSQPEYYCAPPGSIISPAAREYLQQRKIKIGKPPEKSAPPASAETKAPAEQAAQGVGKFVDHETGAFYNEKPEHMTHLVGNRLVAKGHPRIVFRGKLDSLQSMIVVSQALIAQGGRQEKLLADLSEVLTTVRELLRCEVLDEEFTKPTIIGLTHPELRERSHDPMRFYKIRSMELPDYRMGLPYALLNQIRTAARETETAAVSAFRSGSAYTRRDIVEALNRLSSAMHIMMCKTLAGEYGSES